MKSQVSRLFVLFAFCWLSLVGAAHALARSADNPDSDRTADNAAEADHVPDTSGEAGQPADNSGEAGQPPASAAGAGQGAADSDAAAPADAEAELPSEQQAQQQMLVGLTMSDEDRKAYAVKLREVVAAIRGKVTGKISAKLQQGQEKKLDRVAIALFAFSCCGVFLLALPFVLRKKHPNRMGTLFKYSGLAALLFFLAVNLFAVVLFAMRGAQGALGEYTNPQVQIVQSTFDLFANKAEDLALIGPTLVEPTLASLTGESDEPVVSQMLANVQKLKSDFTVFTSMANAFKKVDFLFGILPILLVLIAVVLFAKVARPTLTEIIKLPERAVAGSDAVVKDTVKLTLRNVWAEAKAAFATIGVLVVLTLAVGMLLGLVLQPALEIFISYLTLCLLYVMVSPEASAFWIVVSLGGSIVFLVLNLAVAILASAFFLGKAQQIFQAKFRERTPLRTHLRSWKWGPISALWALVLPVIYIVLAEKGVGWFVEKSMEKYLNTDNIAASNWPFLLVAGPILFIALFVLVFWAARGLRALALIAKYKVAAHPPAAQVGQLPWSVEARR